MSTRVNRKSSISSNHQQNLNIPNIVTNLNDNQPSPQPNQQTLFGVPLKYLSLFTLAIQNATLSILMRYSRVKSDENNSYSPASAVLLTELLKAFISLYVAYSRTDEQTAVKLSKDDYLSPLFPKKKKSFLNTLPGNKALKNTSKRRISLSLKADVSPTSVWKLRAQVLKNQIFSSDSWKLSIPALLYVIQNNLAFVAASNLEVATFQVAYQMKILTTALFSVLLLGKKLNRIKWLALVFLAIGVGIVQMQSSSMANHTNSANMNPFTGFMAVAAACLTSGLAGVYFELVLKGSNVDLWVRNVQLSIFSFPPAILPVLFGSSANNLNIIEKLNLVRNFNVYAWATVFTQVVGGLVTALVIKYSDNILKGFATSISIVLSSIASVALFDFPLTPGFLIGASTVLTSTMIYNKPNKIENDNDRNVMTPSSSKSNLDEKILNEKDINVKLRDRTNSTTFVPAHALSESNYNIQTNNDSSYINNGSGSGCSGISDSSQSLQSSVSNSPEQYTFIRPYGKQNSISLSNLTSHSESPQPTPPIYTENDRNPLESFTSSYKQQQ